MMRGRAGCSEEGDPWAGLGAGAGVRAGLCTQVWWSSSYCEGRAGPLRGDQLTQWSKGQRQSKQEGHGEDT